MAQIGGIELTKEEAALFRKKMQGSVIRTGIGALFHPLHFTKTLIQLGHEPYPLTKGKAFIVFGREGYYLRNGISYCRSIINTHGVSTVYGGLGASLCNGITHSFAAICTTIWVDRNYPDLKVSQHKNSKDYQPAMNEAAKHALRESITKTAGCLAASPFRVILIRRIASFIGDEVEYNTIFSSFNHIYQTEGVKGFFKGVIPQILAEVGTIFLIHGLTFAVDRAFLQFFNEEAEEDESDLDDELDEVAQGGAGGGAVKVTTSKLDTEDVANAGIKNLRKVTKMVLPFVVNGMVYPYQLVSTLMTVNNCGLIAGMAPYQPPFDSWQDCYTYMQAMKQLKRGAKFFLRAHTGAITYIGGNIYASKM